jgi:adenylate cyclase
MRKLAVGIAIGASAFLATQALVWLGAFDDVELTAYDRRLVASHSPTNAHNDIVIIEINESSMDTMEPVFGRWPWPRMVHAGVVDYVARAGAKVIVYDILFVDHDRRGAFPVGDRTMSGPESDAMLVDSVGRAGNVILAANVAFEGLESATGPVATAPPIPGISYEPGAGFPTRPYLALPIDALSNVSAGVGHTFFERDNDGTARRIYPFVEAQGRMIPWLGLTAAMAAQSRQPEDVRLEGESLRIGDTRLALLPSRQTILRQHGPYATADGARTYTSVPFFDVLRSEEQFHAGQPTAVDPAIFKDKIVFVGLTALSENDIEVSPFGGPPLPGVQLHAAAADDVLSGRTMRRVSPATDVMVTAGASLVTGVIAVVVPVAWAIGIMAVLATGLVWALTVAVGQGVWIAVVAPVVALLVAAFGGTVWQYVVEGRQKRQIKSLFGRYVSPAVYAHLVANPDTVQLGGLRRDMSVLFSDIRGFTTAAEKASPEEVVGQLNEYFSAMVEVLFRHHGTLDKFVGDMVMGLFGAPVDDPRHADHAVAAAVEMVDTLGRLNAAWTARGMPTLDIGIGVNSGEMIAGNIGSSAIMSYTVIGDAVNLGARLESLNKDYGTTILISDATRARLTIPVQTREIGAVTVKGKTTAVIVHAVDVTPERARETR